MKSLMDIREIENRIFVIRDEKVMIDRDLANLYGVTTKRLNEQVKRNASRFPADFMFRLTIAERAELVAECDRFDIHLLLQDIRKLLSAPEPEVPAKAIPKIRGFSKD